MASKNTTKGDIKENAAPEASKTVRMVRDSLPPGVSKGPLEADVAPHLVGDYQSGGWREE